MPWNFTRMGTLSSVTQRADSAEGLIFTTCLIINEVCVLLSRYTLVLYDRECVAESKGNEEHQDRHFGANDLHNDHRGGWLDHHDEANMYHTPGGKDILYLAALQTERFWSIALRVAWLIFPPVLMLITAAVPSATYDDEEEEQVDDGGDDINKVDLDKRHHDPANHDEAKNNNSTPLSPEQPRLAGPAQDVGVVGSSTSSGPRGSKMSKNSRRTKSSGDRVSAMHDQRTRKYILCKSIILVLIANIMHDKCFSERQNSITSSAFLLAQIWDAIYTSTIILLQCIKYMIQLHRVVLFAMGLLLIFETRQLLWSENVNLRLALFGPNAQERRELQGKNLQEALWSLAQAQSGFCGNHDMQVAAVLRYPWLYFPRALCLVLGWFFCAVFAVLCHVLQQSDSDEQYTGEAAGGRLIPQAASLRLPRAVFVSEVLAMLFVFGLPVWPMLQNWHGFFDKRNHAVGTPGTQFTTTGKDPFTPIADGVGSLMDIAWWWTPSCGTYADYLMPFYNSTAQASCGSGGSGRDLMWWELPYEKAFNDTYWSGEVWDQYYK
ncbi:unnamed protein product [Amoebophrya sp. A120]|nr:unnamed protein product [Amoebophrya sp. A120]|eukprot:GSA120T00008855001.1